MVIMVLNKIKVTCLKGGGEVIIQQVKSGILFVQNIHNVTLLGYCLITKINVDSNFSIGHQLTGKEY